MEIILKKKHGEHNYKQKYDMKNEALPGFEPGVSLLLGQAILPLSHSNTWVRRQWMEIIVTNKPGKHNYKQKYDLKMRHYLDLNQGSPVY